MQEINDTHNEALEDFQLYFSDYFNVSLAVDEDIPNYQGEEFQKVCIVIKDVRADKSWQVLLKDDNTYHYNVWEDVVDELRNPDDLWKYLYFDVAGDLQRFLDREADEKRERENRRKQEASRE